MGTSDRQNLWLAVPPATGAEHVIHVPAASSLNISMLSSAEEFATMPPKNGEIEELLNACGRNPSATLRLAVPDSLSAMVAATTFGADSGTQRAASSAELPAATPAVASAKAQLGIGTARISRQNRRQDWKIWSAPIAACAVLAFALVHSSARGGSAQAAAPTHPAITVNAAVAAAQPPAATPGRGRRPGRRHSRRAPICRRNLLPPRRPPRSPRRRRPRRRRRHPGRP